MSSEFISLRPSIVTTAILNIIADVRCPSHHGRLGQPFPQRSRCRRGDLGMPVPSRLAQPQLKDSSPNHDVYGQMDEQPRRCYPRSPTPLDKRIRPQSSKHPILGSSSGYRFRRFRPPVQTQDRLAWVGYPWRSWSWRRRRWGSVGECDWSFGQDGYEPRSWWPESRYGR